MKGFWKRTKEWLTGVTGRVRKLFDELPDAREIVAELHAENLLRLGDAVSAVEPEDSRLLRAVVKLANLLDFVAPVAGIGGDKERALLAKIRQVAKLINVADDKLDALWESKLRPELVRYIAAKRADAGALAVALDASLRSVP